MHVEFRQMDKKTSNNDMFCNGYAFDIGNFIAYEYFDFYAINKKIGWVIKLNGCSKRTVF